MNIISTAEPTRGDGGELNSEYAEWVNEENVDLNDIELPVAPADLAMPTVSTDEHVKTPWSDK
jgi:hypothetical protein